MVLDGQTNPNNAHEDDTYKGDPVKYELVEDIPGEQAQYELAAKMIDDFANARLKTTRRGIHILDVCCGTMSIPRRALARYRVPFAPLGYETITGVDLDKNYLNYRPLREWIFETCGLGSRLFGIEIETKHADAAEYKHPHKVDLVLASSAYHHMDDGTKTVYNPKKKQLLRNIAEHLEDDGVVIFCENFVPDYEVGDDEGYFAATKEFYTKRIEQLTQMGIHDARIQLLMRVMQYGLDKEYELKASHRIFTEEIAKAGLEIVTQEKVWPEPQDRLFIDDKVGDFVIVAKKKQQ